MGYSSMMIRLQASSFLLLVAGCSTFADRVAQPEEISLQQAMFNVGQSFKALEEGRGDQKLGVIPCEIDVNFNVSAKGTDTTSLGVTGQSQLIVTSATTQRTTSSSPTLGYDAYAEGNRGNQITVKLRHVACLPTTTTATNTQAIRDLERTLRDLGIQQPYSIPGEPNVTGGNPFLP